MRTTTASAARRQTRRGAGRLTPSALGAALKETVQPLSDRPEMLVVSLKVRVRLLPGGGLRRRGRAGPPGQRQTVRLQLQQGLSIGIAAVRSTQRQTAAQSARRHISLVATMGILHRLSRNQRDNATAAESTCHAISLSRAHTTVARALSGPEQGRDGQADAASHGLQLQSLWIIPTVSVS